MGYKNRDQPHIKAKKPPEDKTFDDIGEEIKTILEDKREIHSIHYCQEDGGMHVVGKHGCTKIEVYPENGMYARIPMIAVFYNGKIRNRIPAAILEVVYKTD